MEWSGVALLLLVAVGVIGTGLPAAVVLIMAASAGALLGVVSNIFPASLLWALPGRLINLLENDLLQALRFTSRWDYCSIDCRSPKRFIARAMQCCHAVLRLHWYRAWYWAHCLGR